MVRVNLGHALNSIFTGMLPGTLEHDAARLDLRSHLASAIEDTLASILRLLAATTTRAW